MEEEFELPDFDQIAGDPPDDEIGLPDFESLIGEKKNPDVSGGSGSILDFPGDFFQNDLPVNDSNNQIQQNLSLDTDFVKQEISAIDNRIASIPEVDGAIVVDPESHFGQFGGTKDNIEFRKEAAKRSNRATVEFNEEANRFLAKDLKTAAEKAAFNLEKETGNSPSRLGEIITELEELEERTDVKAIEKNALKKSLIKEYNTIVDNPNYADYEKFALAQIENFDNYSKIVEEFDDVKEEREEIKENQIAADKRRKDALNGGVLSKVLFSSQKTVKDLGRAGARGVANIATLTRTLKNATGANEFGYLDSFAYAAEDLMRDVEESIPTASSLQRGLFENVARFEGKLVVLDDNGEIQSVREEVKGEEFSVDDKFLEEKDSSGETFADRFSKSGLAAEALKSREFTGKGNFLGKVSDGIADLAIQVGQIKGLNSSLGITAKSSALARNASQISVVATSVHRDAFNEAIAAGFDPEDAGRYAVALGVATGSVSTVFNLEQKLAGIGRTKLPKVNKASARAATGRTNMIDRAGESLKQFVGNAVKEGVIEEGFLENGVEYLLKTGYNGTADNPNTEFKQVTVGDVRDDILVGMWVGGLGGGISNAQGRPKYQKDSLLAAVKMPDRFNKVIDSDNSLTEAEKSVHKERVNKLGKELGAIKNGGIKIEEDIESDVVSLIDARINLQDLSRSTSVKSIKEQAQNQINKIDTQIDSLLNINQKSEDGQPESKLPKSESVPEQADGAGFNGDTTNQIVKGDREFDSIPKGQSDSDVKIDGIADPVNSKKSESDKPEAESIKSDVRFTLPPQENKGFKKKLDSVIDGIVQEKESKKELEDIATSGKRVKVEDIANAGEQRTSEVILEKSTNPTEIANAWRNESDGKKSESEFTNEDKINEALKGRKFTEGAVKGIIDTKQVDFNDVKGIRIVKDGTKLKDGKTPISDLSELAEDIGVSDNELEDFLIKYTFSGVTYDGNNSSLKKELGDKFTELTGKKLTPELADQLSQIENEVYRDRELFGEPKKKEILSDKKKRRGFEKRSIRKAKGDDDAKAVVERISEAQPGYYESISLKGIGQEASQRINDKGGIEDAYDSVMKESFENASELKHIQAERQIILQGLGFKMAKAIETENESEIDRLFEKIARLKELISRTGTDTGQASASLGMWRYMGPDAEVADIAITINKGNESKLRKIFGKEGQTLEQHLKDLESKINELYKDLKSRTTDKKKTTAKKIEKIKGDRKKLKKKFTGAIFVASSVAPLTGDAIKYGSQIMWSYVQEGTLRLADARDRVRNYFKNEHDVDLNEMHLDQIEDAMVTERKLKSVDGSFEVENDIEFGKKTKGGIQSKLDVKSRKLNRDSEKELRKGIREILGGRVSDSMFKQIKETLEKNGKLDKDYTKGAIARKFGLRPNLTSKEKVTLHKLLSNLHNAKGGQQKVRAEKEFLNFLGKMEPTTSEKVADMFMSQFYVFVLSGPSTLARALKGALITTGLETAVNFAESPVASLHAIPRAFGKNGIWAGVSQVPEILNNGYSDLDYRDRQPRADDILNRVVNKSWKELKNDPTFSVPKKVFGAVYKTAVTLPVMMYRSLIAIDAILKHGLIEFNAYVETYNKELVGSKNVKDAEFLNRVNKLMGDSMVAEFEKKAADEISELKDNGTWKGSESRYIRSRTKELLQDYRSEEITEKANEEALTTLLMNQPIGTLGQVYRGASDWMTPKKNDPLHAVVFKTALRTIFPFLRVPTNFVNMSLDYTPIGAIRTIKKRRGASNIILPNDPRQNKKHFIRSAIGASVGMFLYASLFGDDEDEKIKDIRITGAGKTDWNENQTIDGSYKPMMLQWKKDKSKGWTAENTESLSYVDNPVGMMLFPFGAITDNILSGDNKKIEKSQNISRMIFNTTQFAYQQSYSQGIKDVVRIAKAFGSGEDKIGRELSKFGAKRTSAFVMPNLYKQGNKLYKGVFDIPNKKADNIIEMIGKDMPFFESYINGDDRDVLGLPKINEATIGLIPDFLLDVVKDNRDQLKEKHKEWRLVLKYPNVTVKEYYPPRKFKVDKNTTVELDAKQYTELRNKFKDEFLAGIRSKFDSLNKIDNGKDLQKKINKVRSNAMKKARKHMERKLK